MKRKQGFTLIELLVVIGIITLLIGILLPALAKARATAIQVTDATQLRQIHTGWVTFGQQFKGEYPVPGVVKSEEPFEPGWGPEDPQYNTTAHLHSLCIMENYYSPELVYAASEPSPNVAVKVNYNYAAYNPAGEGTYWDETFQADLATVSNVSYASTPIGQRRRSRQWRDSHDSNWPIVSNRGVDGGTYEADIYNASRTLEIHGGRRQWIGNVAFNDGHTELARNFTPENVTFTPTGQTEPLRDNIFSNETSPGNSQGPNPGAVQSFHGHDAFLAFVRIWMSEDQFRASWD